jgi:hypothetical protein
VALAASELKCFPLPEARWARTLSRISSSVKDPAQPKTFLRMSLAVKERGKTCLTARRLEGLECCPDSGLLLRMKLDTCSADLADLSLTRIGRHNV